MEFHVASFESLDKEKIVSSLSDNEHPVAVVDGFLNEIFLNGLLDEINGLDVHSLNKSRDYVFAKNKFEKSNISSLGPYGDALKSFLVSREFNEFLSSCVGNDVVVDEAFHGGGLHLGGEGSFLDMHSDFNLHPKNHNLFRDLNILLYLNRDWKPEYKGSLKVFNPNTRSTVEVEPVLNRLVIMKTREYTIHGYDPINFPKDTYRTTVATYAYSQINEKIIKPRSTRWYSGSSKAKSALGYMWPTLVKIKNSLFGSGTDKNQ